MAAASPKPEPPGYGRRLGLRLTRHLRFILSALLFAALVAAFAGGGMAIAHAIVLAFSIASTAFLAAVVHMFERSESASIRERSRAGCKGSWSKMLGSVAVSEVELEPSAYACRSPPSIVSDVLASPASTSMPSSLTVKSEPSPVPSGVSTPSSRFTSACETVIVPSPVIPIELTAPLTST